MLVYTAHIRVHASLTYYTRYTRERKRRDLEHINSSDERAEEEIENIVLGREGDEESIFPFLS